MDVIEIKIPSKKEYVQVVRLATSSLANNFGFNIEEIEDLKVSISEALNNYIPSMQEIKIIYEISDSFVIKVFAKEEKEIDELEKTIRKQILLSLLDEVNMTEEGIVLKKNKN